ncbi:hypothetical protein BDV95DRAFT_558155 [Massariosphaeria phaeospora]|uniref:Uncharacterized protein n=1 Tax=Massariosphaeria phaeospora TaxID=100035 RepID=A0A7C8MI68_9PLEO|nr:hypothetical protein BDV95DRAFT_558155 [Massariosphaeria phaeospora]
MPPKYKPAARRITAIAVGIPVILVVGYDLYKRWDSSIRTKYDAPMTTTTPTDENSPTAT